MKARVIFIYVCVGFLCASCGVGVNPINQEADDSAKDDSLSQELTENSELEAKALTAITDFYGLLNHEQYQRASKLYGGSYEVLVDYNPSIDKGDESSLFRAACRLNGFMCLEILSAELIDGNERGEFIYEVKFANPDGSEFVLGPCCGATEEEMPPKSSFTVHVECEEDGSCLVMDLPPYVP